MSVRWRRPSPLALRPAAVSPLLYHLKGAESRVSWSEAMGHVW